MVATTVFPAMMHIRSYGNPSASKRRLAMNASHHGRDDLVHELNHRDLGAQTSPHGVRHSHPTGSTAPRDRGERRRAGGSQRTTTGASTCTTLSAGPKHGEHATLRGVTHHFPLDSRYHFLHRQAYHSTHDHGQHCHPLPPLRYPLRSVRQPLASLQWTAA